MAEKAKWRQWTWDTKRGWRVQLDFSWRSFGLGFYMVCPRYNGVDFHFAWFTLMVQPPMPKEEK